MESLPKDLWFQIFFRLPVKTILRCLSVCKSWQMFIQHPSFISSHLQHQSRDLMLVRSISYDYGEKGKPECYSLHCDDESFSVYAKHEFPIHHPIGLHYRIVGCCNGIICITDDQFGTSHETYLWNPTIRKCIELPRPMFTYDKVGGFEHELGFGFDEKTNDYKVVRIVDATDRYEASLEFEIYSLRSDIWKKASHLISDLGIGIFCRAGLGRNNHQVYLNGAMHWVGGNRKESLCMVIAFHFSDEVFRCFEPPLDVKNGILSMRKLRPVVYQGSLSLIYYSRRSFSHSSKPKCSIWMMKDYGDSTSWAKHVDVNFSYHVDRVIGSRKNGELLVEIKEGLYSYEPTEGKDLMYLDGIYLRCWEFLQEGHIDGFIQEVYDYDPEYAPKELGIKSETKGGFKYSFYSESYTESLVLLGRMNSAKNKRKKNKSNKKKKKNSAEVAKLRAKESEMIHEEDNNHVEDVVGELQNLGLEGRQC